MKACGSTCRDPENRSKKSCVCGGHQGRRGRKKRRPWRRYQQWKMTSEWSETWLLTSGYLQGYGVRVLRLPLGIC